MGASSWMVRIMSSASRFSMAHLKNGGFELDEGLRRKGLVIADLHHQGGGVGEPLRAGGVAW